MDMPTIGQSLEDVFMHCPQCNNEYDDVNCERRAVRYSSCNHIICKECWKKCTKICPICLTINETSHYVYIQDLKNLWYIPGDKGCRVLTEEGQVIMELEITRYEDKIKQLEMEKNAAMEQLEVEKNRHEMELKTEKMKAKIEIETVQKRSFSCSECEFPVAEYRSHICVDCGLSSGFLTKEDQNLRLNADANQIEKENVMCVGCALEGVHAGHQTVNYQQLKLGPISIEKKKKKDSELVEKRDTVVNSQTIITVARLLQIARVELSKLSEETMNAVTWDEFNSTWNAADIELSLAHSITDNFLNVADDTENSLKRVVAGLEAIRAGCKVFVNNSGKGNIPKGANEDEMKTDCSVSVITDASEWEALSDYSGKSAKKGEF